MTASKQVTIRTKEDFQKIRTNVGQEVSSWTFLNVSFPTGSEKTLSLIRGAKLTVLCCSTDENGNSRQEIVRALYRISGIEDLFLNMDTTSPLLFASDLFLFAYRTPISQRLTKLYIVGGDKYDAKLAKALRYAINVKILMISYANYYQAPNYAFSYYESNAIEEMTTRRLSLKHCKRVFRSNHQGSLEKLFVDAGRNLLVAKMIWSFTFKQPEMKLITLHGFYAISQAYRDYIKELCKVIGVQCRSY